MSALGQYLLTQSWIDREKLDAALLHQQEVGGRLGTCLLEKGFVSEARLLDALATQQQAPAAGAGDLARIPAEVLQLLPPKIASRHLAIPFKIVGARVDIALARTDNLAQLDELSFVMGKTLRPHIGLEVRLYQALETYYEVPCPRRFRQLAERLDASSAGSDAAQSPRAGGEQAPKPAAPLPFDRLNRASTKRIRKLEPPAERSIPLTEAQRRALEPKTVAPELPLTERFARAESPEAIAHVLLAALDEHFVHSLLFRVARDTVSGWLGHGPDIDRDWLAGYSVGLRQATVFRRLERDGTFRGRLESSPPHDSLSRCWGGGLEAECLVAPISVRGRLIGIVYGDRGQLGLRGLDENAVARLVGKAGLAFERLILDRKLRR